MTDTDELGERTAAMNEGPAHGRVAKSTSTTDTGDVGETTVTMIITAIGRIIGGKMTIPTIHHRVGVGRGGKTDSPT
jgi:hypothetical protein